MSTILIDWLQQFEADLKTLAAEDASLAERCRNRCVLTGRVVSLDTGGQLATGECLGIADDGALRLRLTNGEQRFYGGNVRNIA